MTNRESSQSGRVEYVDTGNVLELYSTDIHHVQRAGPCLRLTFAVDRQTASGRIKEPVIHMYLPIDAVDNAIALLRQGAGHGFAEMEAAPEGATVN